MATFKSLEDLAALKKDMKREKEAKAKQTISAIASRINRSSSPHRHEESNVCVYSTTTYNAIDKNVLKKLKESQASKGNSSSTAENASATKQDKKAREKLRRKLERKGLSKNAIKSQLRPCLTWNEEIEEKLERRNRAKREVPVVSQEVRRVEITASEESDTTMSLSKIKVCKLCGKRILGDVLGHFSKEHFSFYVANRSVLESNPGAFSVSEEKFNSTIHLASTCVKPVTRAKKENKPETEPKQPKVHTYNHGKMCRIISDLEEHPQEQTYRGTEEFECDGCERMCKHGRVIFVRSRKTLHLCYACYKHAKSCAQTKRGNKHVYINTPM